ncbi:MAG: hypothetical protein CVU68_00460 [Deltaproteobacteria bacterium HGW-Deltaproteobacteria-3]|nr:MAG: hypothetical protein CVU68_00460 [Deltaproteobacteria bacterium HGW-Deltaproteobacteria-3]
MKRNLCIGMIMAGLILWGCGQEEKQAETPPPATMPTVEQAMDKAKETAGAVSGQAEKTAEAVAEKVAETAAQAKEAVAKPVTTVESIVIDNKNGQVILPHKKHAEAYGCAVCHGDKTPGPFKLGKDAAHALCQGCHKEKKAGPTGCTQCHQKKAKALEGC